MGVGANRRGVTALALATLLPAFSRAEAQTSGSGGAGPVRRSGSVTINQTQVSMLGSIAWGSGTLTFGNRTYRFRVRGVGFGGFGVTRSTADGDVYNLTQVADFGGVYGQVRTGAVAGTTQVQGDVWLQNPAGVRIHLQPQRTGIALQVGADGVHIEME